MRKLVFMAIALVFCGLSGGWTKVTAQRGETRAAEAFDDLGKQGGIHFVAVPDGEKTVSTNFEGTPFWEAALSLSHQIGRSFQMSTLSPIDRDVTFTAATPSIAQTTQGPLTIVLESAVPREHVPGTREITFRVYADPSLAFFAFFDPVELAEARDATGKSLLTPRDPQRLAPNPSLITTHRIAIREPQGQIIAFRGSFTLLVADSTESWSIPTNAAGLEKRVGKNTYAIKSIRSVAADSYQIEAEIRGPSDGGFKGGVVPMMLNDQAIQVADAQGKRWRITGVEASYIGKAATGLGRYTATLKLQPNPGAQAPSSFTWLIPTQVSTVDVRFEFKGLRLP